MNENKDLPGINRESFKITLIPDTFENSTITVDDPHTELVVSSCPKRHRYQWYWKILNWLTFGTFFYEYYTYEVKIINNDSS